MWASAGVRHRNVSRLINRVRGISNRPFCSINVPSSLSNDHGHFSGYRLTIASDVQMGNGTMTTLKTEILIKSLAISTYAAVIAGLAGAHYLTAAG